MKNTAKQLNIASQAFTMVEMMIGSALLILSFTSFILAFIQMQQMSVEAEYSLAAMHAARNEVETLRANAYTNIISYTNIPLSDTILSQTGGQKHCSVTDAYNGYKEIILTITWIAPSKTDQSSLYIATKIYDKDSSL